MIKKRGARLGQHFLNAQWVARDLVAAVAAHEGETLVEIGPGKGALTGKLLATGHPVVAIEKDEALVTHLREIFEKEIASGQFTLIAEDIRNFDPTKSKLQASSYSVAANIPYYITGEIIRAFLTTAHQPRAMALLIQKEVAERIVARDGKESILSLSVKAYGKPKIVAKVPKGCFNPPPSVDSAILLVENISRDFFDTISEDDFFTLVKKGFSAKRKKLAGNLAASAEALAACDVEPNARAEDVPLEKWKRLVESISKPTPADRG